MSAILEWAARLQDELPERPPLLLTRKRADAIVKALNEGLKEDKACEAAGVSLADLNWWLDRGEVSPRGMYADFHRDVSFAQAESTAQASGALFRQISIPLNYAPHKYQRRLHALQLAGEERYKRFIAACCGRRGGKTYGGAAHFAARIMADLEEKLAGRGRWEGTPHYSWERGEGREPKPFLHYWLVAPTYALLDEPKKALQQVLGLVETGGVITHQTDRRWWLLGGIQVEFKSGDNPLRLVGAGLDGAWMDEAARIKPDVWRNNLRPALSDQNGWGLFTTTPLGKNWFWSDIWARGDEDAADELATMEGKRVEDVLDTEMACIAWYTSDNTAIPALAEEMEIAKRQMPEALWRRNYKADFEAFEGQCFDLVRTKHFRTGKLDVNSLVKAWGGVDIGVSKHPAVFVLVGQDRRGRFHELRTELRHKILPHHADAWRARETGNREYMTNVVWAAIEETLGPGYWNRIPIHFPADHGDWRRYFDGAGFRVATAFQSHEPGVTWAQIAFHNELLSITSPVLWRCLVNLRFPDEGETSSKLWVDKDDDAWDAFRYALSEPMRKVKHGKLPMPQPVGSIYGR